MSGSVRLYRFGLLVAAMLLATFALGWAGVLFVAVAFAVLDRRPSVPSETALAAAAAWGILFLGHLIPSVTDPAPGPSMVATVSRAMGIPSLIPPLVTIAFPALLAWSAATVGIALLHLAGRPRLIEPSVRSPAVG